MTARFFIPIFLFFVSQAQAQTLPLTALDSLQKQYFKQGSYRQGLPLIEELVQRTEQQYSRRDTHYFDAVHHQVNYYREVAKHWDMHDIAVRMERDIRQYYGTENRFYANAVGDLASACFFTGKISLSVIDLYQQMVEIRAKVYGKHHPEYARALYNLGTAKISTGRFNEAESLFKESLSILEKTTGEEYGHIITPLGGLATIYSRQKRYAEAEKLYLQALAIAEQYFGKKNRRYNMLSKSIATFYTETGRYTDAENQFLRILASIEQNVGKTHLFFLTSKELADLYIKTQQYEKAQSLLLATLDGEANVIGATHPIRSDTYNYLTRLSLATNQWDKAIESALSALSINAEQPFPNTNIQYVCHHHLLDKATFKNPYFALEALKQLTQAIKQLYQNTRNEEWLGYLEHICRIGIDMTERLKNDVQHETDRFNFLDLQAHFTSDGVYSALLLHQPEQAFIFAEQNKAASLSSALKAQKASFFGELPDSLLQKENFLRQAIDNKNKLIWETTNPQDKEILLSELNELHLQNRQLQAFIKEHFPKYHQLKYRTFSTSVADVQDVLNDDVLLLEYVITDSLVHVFCLTKQELKTTSFPINKKLFEEKTRLFRKSLSHYENIRNNPQEAYKTYTESAFWFYRAFLEQPLALVPNKKHLLIVPDGLLGHLPFEVFLTQAAPANETPYNQLPYLLHQYQVSYSYSASLLAENCRFKCTLNPKILGLAASYPENTTSEIPKTRSPQQQDLRRLLGALPNAQSEVQRLQNLFTGVFLYGDKANERTFKELAPNYGILHLAMHGLLDKQNPLLSSLAFTENGDTTEDNFLQAHEISHLQLNSILVVLSACETGYGKFQAGEGIMSLGRAFMYAGSPALVVSLWAVNDASTAKIMESFYLHLSSGVTKAEALRQAKLQYIAQAKGFSAHPAYWSAFVQIGDSRPVQLRQQADFWVFYALSILVIVAGFMVFRKKWRGANS